MLAIGTSTGSVQIWDAYASQRVATFEGHTARVGALAWKDGQISSGSRDRSIIQRDVRNHSTVTSNVQDRTLTGHKQEVCILCFF